MDIKKLISLMHRRPSLWDNSNRSYHARDIQKISWRQVSQEMGIPENILKKKWRGIRDTFTRKLKKATENKLSDETTDGELCSDWPYFELLMFLRESVCRKQNRDVPETHEDMNFDVEDDKSTSMEFNDPLYPDELPPQTAKFQSPPNKKQKIEEIVDIEEKLQHCGEETVQYVKEKNENDPDSLFLMSLLPFLHDVPKHRKLLVRTKLLQVFVDDERRAF